jgi:ionotropic glutamate receptor
VGETRLGIGSFSGLFLMCAMICLFALLVYFIRLCWQYNKYSSSEAADEPSAADAHPAQLKPSDRGSFKGILKFVDKKEEEIRRSRRRRSSDKDNQAAGTSGALSVSSPH